MRAREPFYRVKGFPAIHDQHWRQHAACRDHDPELWNDPPSPPTRDEIVAATKAISICEGCPVKTECLADAIKHDERFGIRAGRINGGRSAFTRRLAPLPPCGTDAGYKAHLRRATAICQECRDAHNAYNRERRSPPTRKAAACGTRSGYLRHLRQGERSCQPCNQANTANTLNLRRRKKEAA